MEINSRPSDQVNSEFWNGKKVFLTGHTGFKGTWLSLWLQSMGAIVTGYSLAPPTDPSAFQLTRAAEGMTSIIGNVNDLSVLKKELIRSQAEIVFHMAAQSLVLQSYEEPVETYMTNVMGTVHLLESVRATPSVRSVIIVTSDKCYENREWLWPYRENEAMGGFDPYSSSKGCAELVTSAYSNSFFPAQKFSEHRVAIASVRAGNVIGGGDWAPKRLIPDLIQAFAEKKPAVIRNPDAIRPWQHVLEPLSGYLILAEQLFSQGTQMNGGWNFGPDGTNHQNVEWIAKNLSSAWGDSAKCVIEKSEKSPHEAHTLMLDSTKARLLLSWQAGWQIDQALQAVVEWYRAFYAKEDLRKVSLSQIQKYMESRS